MKPRGMKFAAMIGAGVFATIICGIAAVVDAQTEPAKPDSATAAKSSGTVHQYVGVKKCKVCHSSEKGGAQYGKWLGSKHAKAYEALASDLAKSIAAKKGIADPQQSGECLQCHQTGYGEPADHFAAAFVPTDGVQCESCHGAGKDYVAKKTMQGIYDGTLKAADYGLVMPTKERCAQCHNQTSPTFLEMNYTADSTKIAHPIPPGYKRGGAEDDKEGTK